MFDFTPGTNAHMPFAAPDQNGMPFELCCRPVNGVWKLHCFDGTEWKRIQTGRPEQETECAPTAEWSDGEWNLTFIAGSTPETPRNYLYRMRGIKGTAERIAPADVGYCRENWTVSGQKRGPLHIFNGQWTKTLEIAGMQYLYRVSYDPGNPSMMLLSGQRFDGSVFTWGYDLIHPQLLNLTTSDGKPVYKCALWKNQLFYAEKTGSDFESREIRRADAWSAEPIDLAAVTVTFLEKSPDMNCVECLRKHISGALSYAKEVMNGHGADAELDHRADLEGEIKNAEDHAAQITNGNYRDPLRDLRHKLESQEWIPMLEDLNLLRRIWKSSMGLSCKCRKPEKGV